MNNSIEYIQGIINAADAKERKYIIELVSGDHFDLMTKKQRIELFKKATEASK